FFVRLVLARCATCFPYTPLFRSCGWERLYLHAVAEALNCDLAAIARHYRQKDDLVEAWLDRADSALFARAKSADLAALGAARRLDRKSTRLNSSHVKISYAVFCL